MKYPLLITCISLLYACTSPRTYDLAITHADVFDTKTGNVLHNKTVLINADTIAAITDSITGITCKKIIDAKGKLVTPGIIDAHIHPGNTFGDYDAAPGVLPPDSVGYYRKLLSDNYLPYGVTTVMIMGQPERWLAPILYWSQHPSPGFVDVYTVGGALISKEERKPYIGHITVESPEAARQKVLEYYKLGIRHIKLYWRLRRPEFEAAYRTADSLGMHVYGHIDEGIMTMDSTTAIGLHNYEHVFTIVHNAPFADDTPQFVAWMDAFYGKEKWQSLSFFELQANEVRWLVEQQPKVIDSFLTKLAANHASFSTTVHLFGEKLGATFFSNDNNKPDASWSNERTQRNKENFAALMGLLKKVYDKGIPLRIGTDCGSGGKSAVSEQLLMAECGIPVAAVIQISTINAARALVMDHIYGSIEQGKKADLLIYDKSPLEDYHNFLTKKTIIKDGKVYVQ